MSRSTRPYQPNIEAMRRRVLEGPGELTPTVRSVIYAGEDGPAGMSEYLAKVRARAYRVTDAEVEELKRAGHSEDEIYEATVAAAMGAGMSRLDAVMKLLEEA